MGLRVHLAGDVPWLQHIELPGYLVVGWLPSARVDVQPPRLDDVVLVGIKACTASGGLYRDRYRSRPERRGWPASWYGVAVTSRTLMGDDLVAMRVDPRAAGTAPAGSGRSGCELDVVRLIEDEQVEEGFRCATIQLCIRIRRPSTMSTGSPFPFNSPPLLSREQLGGREHDVVVADDIMMAFAGLYPPAVYSYMWSCRVPR